ncbi:MAG: hypothetical protein KDK36_13210, partial [Leptospiraceae bacterium]|nr:hypothetical protein [Leptospiraceae bacterium]
TKETLKKLELSDLKKLFSSINYEAKSCGIYMSLNKTPLEVLTLENLKDYLINKLIVNLPILQEFYLSGLKLVELEKELLLSPENKNILERMKRIFRNANMKINDLK